MPRQLRLPPLSSPPSPTSSFCSFCIVSFHFIPAFSLSFLLPPQTVCISFLPALAVSCVRECVRAIARNENRNFEANRAMPLGRQLPFCTHVHSFLRHMPRICRHFLRTPESLVHRDPGGFSYFCRTLLHLSASVIAGPLIVPETPPNPRWVN